MDEDGGGTGWGVVWRVGGVLSRVWVVLRGGFLRGRGEGGDGEDVLEVLVGDFEGEDVRLVGVFVGVVGAVPVGRGGGI